MYKIGLTGGICTGKSYVLKVLEEVGCYTERADTIANKIIFSGNSEVSKKIIEVFGTDVYDEKTGINKEKFAGILFADTEKRTFIHNFVHPLVTRERNRKYNDLKKRFKKGYFVYESALLVESGIYREFDKLIVTYTSLEEQLRRLIERDNLSREKAEERIKAQFPVSEKLKVADFTIDTTGTFETTQKKTLEVFHFLQKSLEKDTK